MAAIVRETADGWEVVDGTKATAYATRREALDAARALLGDDVKQTVLRDADTGEPNGAWRWIHATNEEAESIDNARIDAVTVRELVDSLNAKTKAEPIVGGTADSPSHINAGNHPANGYAHQAVEVVDADGTHGAYAWSEFVTEVDANIATGRLAWASIGAGGTLNEDGAIRNADWDHVLITNKPAQHNLVSGSAVRTAGERVVAVRSYPLTPRIRMATKIKTTVRSELAKLALRGPALDALTKLCASLGISMDDEMASEEWESPSVAAVRAVRTLAAAEKTLEALTGAPAEAARSLARNVIATRAEVADADLEMLAKALGLEPGAAVADMIKAAEGMEPKKAPEMTEAEKAEAAKLAAEKSAAGETLVALRSEVAALRAKDEAREDAAFLDGVLALRKMTLRAETREQMLTVLRTDRKAGRATVEGLVKEIHVPPTGTVVPAGGTSTDPLDEATNEPTRAQINAEIALIRAAHPNDPQHVLHARARKNLIARKR